MNAKGTVIQGSKRGREIGFPTANIKNSTNIDSGIYAGQVMVQNTEYDAVIYIGEKRKDILEAHIFEFNGDLYGKEIVVRILGGKIREDKEMSNIPDIKEQIKEDIEKAKEIIKKS